MLGDAGLAGEKMLNSEAVGHPPAADVFDPVNEIDRVGVSVIGAHSRAIL